MFAKVFGQIFDSSIAEKYQTRHVFMDLLVLADAEGVVDMTHQAIARRTNVPLGVVTSAIIELMEPDKASRSKEDDGRRLQRLDEHRDWGWRIVNYLHYRKLLDEDARRSYFRDYRRRERAEKAHPASDVQSVQLGSTKFTQEEEEALERERAKKRPTRAQAVAFGPQAGVTSNEAGEWWDAREAADWMRGTAGGGALPVGSNWQADLKSWCNTKRERKQDNAKRSGNHRTDDLNKAGRYK